MIEAGGDKMTRLERLKRFLHNEEICGMQSFDCRNWVGDLMDNIYNEDGIQVDICYGYEYLEIFGLTHDEWLELAKEGYVDPKWSPVRKELGY